VSSDSVATWSSHGRVTCLNRLNSGNEVDEGSLAVSEIGPAVRGTPIICQRVSQGLRSITARHFISGRQPNCGVQQRSPPTFNRVTITLGIGPHF